MGHREFARAALLRAALTAMADRGLPGLRSQEIAEAAGVSVGTFYTHFADVEELTRVALAQAAQAMDRFIREAAEEDGEPRERFSRIFRAVFRCVHSDSTQGRFFLLHQHAFCSGTHRCGGSVPPALVEALGSPCAGWVWGIARETLLGVLAGAVDASPELLIQAEELSWTFISSGRCAGPHRETSSACPPGQCR